MDQWSWMRKAINKIGDMKSGSDFCLKDLFDGVEWNDLSPGDRRNFGRHFKNEVKEGNIPNIIYIGKAQNNSAKYKKEMY